MRMKTDNPILTILKKCVELSDRITAQFCVALYILFSVVSINEVILRYVLNRPQSWSEAVSRHLFVWSLFLGSAITMKNYGHISLDFLTRKFSVKLKRTSKILAHLVIFFFSIKLLTMDGLFLAVNAWSQESPALGLPVTLIYAALPAGGILMALFSLFEIVSAFTQ